MLLKTLTQIADCLARFGKMVANELGLTQSGPAGTRLAKLAILPFKANLRQPLNLNKPSGPGLCQASCYAALPQIIGICKNYLLLA
jgi:hypothetical protein